MPTTRVSVSTKVAQYTIATLTTVDGAWTELSRLNIGGTFTRLWFELTNGHATAALTDFELAIVPATWLPLPTLLPYVTGAGWIPGTNPERLVFGAPNTLAALGIACAYVDITGAPGIVFRARQTINPAAAPITIHLTLSN